MSTGWGLQPYGLSGFGISGTTLSVVRAFAISTHEVVVELARAPLNVSGFVDGDVSNPRSWSVTIPATGAVLDVAGVLPYQPPLQWLVRTLQRFADSTGVVRVAASVKDSSGGGIQSPATADFVGVTEQAISNPQNIASTKLRAGRDLRNVTAPAISGTSLGGALSISGGDYVLSDGPELIKKLITRRLMTTPGEFFHIPSYGVGIQVKQPLPGGGLVRLKTQIQKQVLLEPDVQAASVSLVQTDNTLTCIVEATLTRTGQNVTVSVDSQIGQG